MDENNFRRDCKKVIEFICEYMSTLPERRIQAETRDSYLLDVLPKKAPERSQDFHTILKVVQDHLLPGLVQWRHPRYFGYLPSGGSHVSLVANMLASTVNAAGFSWASCPAIAELEALVLDWLCEMLGLPAFFLSSGKFPLRGGGSLQLSAADATLATLMSARHKKLREAELASPSEDRRLALPRMVAYCSAPSLGSVQRAAEVAMVRLRPLEVDDRQRLRGPTLEAAMREDSERGLEPAYVWAGLGSNPHAACDALAELGPVCEAHGAWLHVDAAYAGAAFACPELRGPALEGVEFAQSFCVDPSIWLLTNFDCCALWVSNRRSFVKSFILDPPYMAHAYSDHAVDFRHWGLPLSRRFRSLKLWFVIRLYGVEGLQKHIREHIRLARVFEGLVRGDDRFEVVNEVLFGVVCFRQKGCNELNMQLLGAVNAAGRCFLVGVKVGTSFMLRFCMCNESTTEEDVRAAWAAVVEVADKVKNLHEAISHKCK